MMECLFFITEAAFYSRYCCWVVFFLLSSIVIFMSWTYAYSHLYGIVILKQTCSRLARMQWKTRVSILHTCAYDSFAWLHVIMTYIYVLRQKSNPLFLLPLVLLHHSQHDKLKLIIIIRWNVYVSSSSCNGSIVISSDFFWVPFFLLPHECSHLFVYKTSFWPTTAALFIS